MTIPTATPVAGSLGDVVTLGMLSCFASQLYRWHQGNFKFTLNHEIMDFKISIFYL